MLPDRQHPLLGLIRIANKSLYILYNRLRWKLECHAQLDGSNEYPYALLDLSANFYKYV
jgi:hypothetical protein